MPHPFVTTTLLALAVGLTGTAGGCRRERVPDRFGRAVLTGQVKLAADARMPEYLPGDLARLPLHPSRLEPPAACTEANEQARRPVRIGEDGGLSGIVVAASDFTHAALGKNRKAVRHRVSIRGCRLQPPVIAARDGDWLEITNEDEFAFSPLMGPALRSMPMKKNARARLPLQGGRVESLLCTPNAPCGRSDIVVFYHPVFAVTDARGRFRIPDFPDSELVRVTAWHPLFEPAENFTWVEPGESALLDLQLTPKQRFLPRRDHADGGAATASPLNAEGGPEPGPPSRSAPEGATQNR